MDGRELRLLDAIRVYPSQATTAGGRATNRLPEVRMTQLLQVLPPAHTVHSMKGMPSDGPRGTGVAACRAALLSEALG